MKVSELIDALCEIERTEGNIVVNVVLRTKRGNHILESSVKHLEVKKPDDMYDDQRIQLYYK